jgi:hypothetical protein
LDKCLKLRKLLTREIAPHILEAGEEAPRFPERAGLEFRGADSGPGRLQQKPRLAAGK